MLKGRKVTFLLFSESYYQKTYKKIVKNVKVLKLNKKWRE